MATVFAWPCLPASSPGSPVSRPADQPPGHTAARPPPHWHRAAGARAGHRSRDAGRAWRCRPRTFQCLPHAKRPQGHGRYISQRPGASRRIATHRLPILSTVHARTVTVPVKVEVNQPSPALLMRACSTPCHLFPSPRQTSLPGALSVRRAPSLASCPATHGGCQARSGRQAHPSTTAISASGAAVLISRPCYRGDPCRVRAAASARRSPSPLLVRGKRLRK